MLPDKRPSDLRVDKVYWQLPVTLDLQAGRARFSGVAGRWRYVIAHPTTLGALYDISDPLRPQVLTAAWGADLRFEDGPAVREYLVVGPGLVHSPTILPHQPIQLAATAGADVVYIAPAHFFAELAPLVTRRQAQGYRVVLVDVQAIYEGWSFGQVDPVAIRSFLRYAVATWQPAPLAATLVGDGTLDPHTHLSLGNPNIIPPYLADVDPWIGEAACENCYAQLDGDDPVGATEDPGFLIDIWLGRLSVQNPAQLHTVVDKILRYETGPRLDNWAYASLYIADDYVHADGVVDQAGDFAFFQDLIVTGDPARGLPPYQSQELPAVRVYYDPRPGGVQHAWHVPDAVEARLRVIDAFQEGPQLVVYNGHANQYQWGSTVRSLENPFLFGTNDVAELRNLDRLPIVLGMTCFTAQFANASTSGTTLDERFQRQDNGGAAAVWGSAGLTVIYGQDALMRGFHGQLWSRPPRRTRLGELVEAGYFALFSQQGCCQSTNQVYLLLGDPLTPALIAAPSTNFLPLVQR